MKVKAVVVMSAVGMLAVLPQITLGDYTTIEHGLLGGGYDTSFDGTTLRVQQSPANNLTLLTDSGQIYGEVANAAVDMWTTYSHFDPTVEANYPNGSAWFTGGNYSLSFTFTPTGGTAGNYYISGPMDVLKVGATSAYYVSGEGRWTATSISLPGPDEWITGADGWSGIHSLTLNVGIDMLSFDWDTGTFAKGNTVYNISPTANAIPEPTALLLLVLGSVGLLRRRIG